MRIQCRLQMNGVASTSMREKGLNYKLNFGLTIPQIKLLATKYQADEGLAEALWKEETRELKILATLLYPTGKYTKMIARSWITQIPNQEIREQLSINLLQNLPFAGELASEWSNTVNEDIRTSGYWLLARILIAGKSSEGIISSCAFSHIYSDILSEDHFLHNAANLALKHLGRQSKTEADNILNKLLSYKEDPDPTKREIYDSLSFEFEFYHK